MSIPSAYQLRTLLLHLGFSPVDLSYRYMLRALPLLARGVEPGEPLYQVLAEHYGRSSHAVACVINRAVVQAQKRRPQAWTEFWDTPMRLGGVNFVRYVLWWFQNYTLPEYDEGQALSSFQPMGHHPQ